MDITIGVQNQSRELNLESDESSDDVAAKVTAALEGSKVLELTDSKGRRLLLPTASIGYIELGSEEQRPVGFGALA